MMQEILLELLKYCLPSLAMGGIVYLFLKHFEKNEARKLGAQQTLSLNKEIIPIKLQAFERLTLLLERITPSNLIMRLRTPDMTSGELHQLLLFTIRQEYEHNIAQQLYISASSWQMINLAKDQIINDINQISSRIPHENSAMELSRNILQFYIEKNEPMPSQRCIDIIKNEFNQVFG
jgi:hypothetical protein